MKKLFKFVLEEIYHHTAVVEADSLSEAYTNLYQELDGYDPSDVVLTDNETQETRIIAVYDASEGDIKAYKESETK